MFNTGHLIATGQILEQHLETFKILKDSYEALNDMSDEYFLELSIFIQLFKSPKYSKSDKLGYSDKVKTRKQTLTEVINIFKIILENVEKFEEKKMLKKMQKSFLDGIWDY